MNTDERIAALTAEGQRIAADLDAAYTNAAMGARFSRRAYLAAVPPAEGPFLKLRPDVDHIGGAA